ncbi:MAG: hypothetical protein ACTSPB_01640 [Candidatus Thorarchaeota archaeon]
MDKLTGEFKYYLTGANSDGEVQSEPTLSLGGYRGSEISEDTIRSVFDHVASSESLSGDTEYRCIAIRNESLSTQSNVKVWIESNTSSSDTYIEIGIEAPSAQPDGYCQSITSESISPIGISFSSSCTSYATGLSIGDMDSGEIYFIWIKRVVKSGARPAYDSFSIKVQSSLYTFKFRERRRSDNYDPNISFSNEGTSKFRMLSTYTSIGSGYLVKTFNRNDLDGKTIRITWNGEFSHQFVASPGRTYAHIRVYDGELDPYEDSDWPSVGGSFKGQGVISNVTSKSTDNNNPSTFSETASYSINLGQGDFDTCTLVVELTDAWVQARITVDVDKIEILDGDVVEYSYDFPSTDAVTMVRSGTTADYGYIEGSGTHEVLNSSYCITDPNTPTERAVLQNGLVRIRSRLESDSVDAGSIDIWFREEEWDGSDSTQDWIYIGRIKPETNVFDSQCPWSRIYTSYIDINKTVLRFFFNSSTYMDLTLYRGSQGVKMEWSSGISGYVYLDISDSARSRFAYGEGADIVDATLDTSDSWHTLGDTNNWAVTWDDNSDFFIGMSITDDSVALRCYTDSSDDSIAYLSLGSNSSLDSPHYVFYSRRVTTTFYDYNDISIGGSAKIARDKLSTSGYGGFTPYATSTDHQESGDWWYIGSSSTRRRGTLKTVSSSVIYRVGFHISQGGGSTSGAIYYRIRRASDDKILAETYVCDKSDLNPDDNPTWVEADIGPVFVDGQVRICVEYENSYLGMTNADENKRSDEYLTYWDGSWHDSSTVDCKYRLYTISSYVMWSCWNVCDDENYRTVVRKRHKDGSYSYADTAGDTLHGRVNIGFYEQDYYWDYLVYIPKKCRDIIGVSGPEDVAEELLDEWDYGIYLSSDEQYYDILPTYSVQTNSWGISPSGVVAVPSVLDYLSSGSVDFYRAVIRDFSSSIRKQDTDATPATPANWTTITSKIDAIDASCLKASSTTPGTISWSVSIPDGYYWAFVRLHAETDGTIYYQIRSDDVGTTYYDLKDSCYQLVDRADPDPSDQSWSYFEGYFRVEPGTTNTITLNGVGASGSQRYIIDYIDVVPVVSIPFVSSSVEVVPIGDIKINRNRWRNMFNSASAVGRAEFDYLDVNTGIDMNKKQLLYPVVEKLSSDPTGITGRIYYNTSTKKFRGYNGSSWNDL